MLGEFGGLLTTIRLFFSFFVQSFSDFAYQLAALSFVYQAKSNKKRKKIEFSECQVIKLFCSSLTVIKCILKCSGPCFKSHNPKEEKGEDQENSNELTYNELLRVTRRGIPLLSNALRLDTILRKINKLSKHHSQSTNASLVEIDCDSSEEKDEISFQQPLELNEIRSFEFSGEDPQHLPHYPVPLTKSSTYFGKSPTPNKDATPGADAASS